MDWGEKGNLLKYNNLQPPEYNLTQISSPVALFYGDGDLLITKEVRK